MILSNVSVPLLGMVDTGVTGHLDDAAYLGAVAVGSAMFGFMFIAFNFLRMGTTGLAAQQFGREDYSGLRSTLGQAVIAALGIAALMLIGQGPIGSIGLGLIGADENVLAPARDYFFVRVWSAPATLVNYALVGWFIGLQNTRVPLLIVVATNLINIGLDLLFVLVLGMKVAGVAAASVIAETSGMLLGFYFVFRELERHEGAWQIEALLKPARYRAFFAINANLFVRTVTLVSTFTFITAQGARLGGLILAANAILMNLQNLVSFVLDALAHSAEALIGKSIGQGSTRAVEKSVAVTLKWSFLMAVGASVLIAVGGPLIVRLLTDLPEVRKVALTYLPWMIASPVISVWAFLYDGVFVGATRAKEMRNMMLASALVVFLPAWYLLQPFGNHGLWLSFTLFMAARGGFMYWAYRQRVWPGLVREIESGRALNPVR